MTLKDIVFKKAYSSGSDNILEDFYIPALRASAKYHRLAGLFSSKSLTIASRGILGLIKNGGYTNLIVAPKFTKNDLVKYNHCIIR